MSVQEIDSLRILWLTENYHPARGGMAQSCDRIVDSLRKSAITVDVVHFSPRAEELRVEKRSGGNLISCPPGTDPSHAMNCLWNAIYTHSNEIAHVVAFGGVLPLIAGPVYAAWLGVPLITMIRGNDFDTAIFTPRRAEILREALRRSARVTVVSRDKAAKINALFPEICPFWIPNGINLDLWEPLPSQLQRAEQWRRDTVEPGRRVLGMFGHIKQKKGGLFFLQALLASGCADRFHLLFVGELDEEVTNWLADHSADVASTVQPFADRYDLLSYYPACDFVVIASLYDGLPNVLLEAAALGVPLLASTAGGMGDVLEDGCHGFLFRPGNLHDCRKALMLAAEVSADELERMGSLCRALVQSRLNHELETERYLSVFRETPGRTANLVEKHPVCESVENR